MQLQFYHWAENIQLSFIPPQERLKPLLSGCQSTAQMKNGGDKVTSSPHRAGVRTSWGDMRVPKKSEPKCKSITGPLYLYTWNKYSIVKQLYSNFLKSQLKLPAGSSSTAAALLSLLFFGRHKNTLQLMFKHVRKQNPKGSGQVSEMISAVF